MTEEELKKLVVMVRENLITSGYNPNMIETRPVTATAMWIHESRLALRPAQLAIAYQAIAWTLSQKLKEAKKDEQPAGD